MRDANTAPRWPGMMVLGVSDAMDAGAALVSEGRILAAVNEERLSRRKFHTGFPRLSIPEVLNVAGVSPSEIDVCAYAGAGLSLCTTPDEESFDRPNLSKAAAMGLSRLGVLRWLFGEPSGVTLYRAVFRGLLRPTVMRLRRYLDALGASAAVVPVDHHTTHAAAAAATSGWADCLVLTMDASGDGYCSLVAERRGGVLRDAERVGAFHSLGIFYLYATLMLGHKPGREGKLTGLAAHGDPERALPIFRRYCDYDPRRGQIRNRAAGYACDYAALKGDLNGLKPEDVAAGVQRHFEECITRYAARWVERTGLRRIALAGGVFSNVIVNQRLRETPGVEDVYVFPHMGDGGGAVGAAMEVCRRLDPGRCLDNSFEHLYLGPAFTRGQIEAELPRHAGLSWRPVDDPDVALARAVAQGKVVARFDGPMEYGPRALGNRSILCHATDASVNDWLNQRLRRTEYMPFAPTILERRAAECLEGWRPEHRAAWFMTTTYRGTPGFRGCAQGVVNVDHTTRPQVLRHSANPGYHRLIEEHERLTGLPYVLNTSFNMHEEPIVCTPRDALRAFRQARLDLMGLGPYLVEPREG